MTGNLQTRESPVEDQNHMSNILTEEFLKSLDSQ